MVPKITPMQILALLMRKINKKLRRKGSVQGLYGNFL
jgi:hypothetical protein